MHIRERKTRSNMDHLLPGSYIIDTIPGEDELLLEEGKDERSEGGRDATMKTLLQPQHLNNSGMLPFTK